MDSKNSEQMIVSSEQSTMNSEHLDAKSSEHLEQLKQIAQIIKDLKKSLKKYFSPVVKLAQSVASFKIIKK